MKVNYFLTKSCVSDVKSLKNCIVSKYRNYLFLKNKTENCSEAYIEVEYALPSEELNPLDNYEISLESSYNHEGNELVIEDKYTCTSVELRSFFTCNRERKLAVDYYFRKDNSIGKYSIIHIHDEGDNILPEFVVGKQYTLVIK